MRAAAFIRAWLGEAYDDNPFYGTHEKIGETRNGYDVMRYDHDNYADVISGKK